MHGAGALVRYAWMHPFDGAGRTADAPLSAQQSTPPRRRHALNDVERYFVEEYHEGHLSRRDLIRRVLFITGGVASAAATLIALGCGSDSEPSHGTGAAGGTASPAATAARVETPAPTVAATSPTAAATAAARGAATLPPATNSADSLVREDDPTIQAGRVEFAGPAGTVFGYLARPRTGGPVPGIILVHENQGLVEPNMDIARRYAKEGFAALAVDLLSRAGGTERLRSDPAQIPAALGRVPQEEHAADLAAGIAYLKTVEGVRPERFGVSGFCFGGGMSFALATASPEIVAAVPYYGNARVEELGRSQAPFLVFYGETDARLTAQAPAVEAALRAAGRTVEIVVAPGAGHAFFRNGGNSYNAAAARDAWPRTLTWFARHLGA
jgi:carboxymethylenebutenolidase